MSGTNQDQRLLQLTHDLVVATRAGRVQWEDTADDDAFHTMLGEGMIRVEKASDRSGSVSYTLVAMTNRSREISRLETDEDHSELRELWEIARRSARCTDDVFRSFFDALSEKMQGPAGSPPRPVKR